MLSEQDRLARIRKAIVKQERVRLSEIEIGSKGMEYICARKVQHVNEMVLWLNDIQAEGMRFFPRAHWDKLFYLQINKNLIGNLGCKYLSRTAFVRIQQIKLCFNSIGSTGLHHLSKGRWPTLNKIYISNNYITQCGKSISKAYWQKITWIKLTSNSINELEVILLLYCSSQYMGQLDLFSNKIHKDSSESLLKIWKDKHYHIYLYV